jgi:hypothetical protein
MANAHDFQQLSLQLALGADAVHEDLDAAVLQLRRELVELDVIGVRRTPGPPAPDGARAIDGPLLGALLVTASDGALPALVQALSAWTRRSADRSVRLQLGDDAIELTGASDETQRELVDAFLARHRAADP